MFSLFRKIKNHDLPCPEDTIVGFIPPKNGSIGAIASGFHFPRDKKPWFTKPRVHNCCFLKFTFEIPNVLDLSNLPLKPLMFWIYLKFLNFLKFTFEIPNVFVENFQKFTFEIPNVLDLSNLPSKSLMFLQKILWNLPLKFLMFWIYLKFQKILKFSFEIPNVLALSNLPLKFLMFFLEIFSRI